MPRGARSPGAVRRHVVVIHERIRAEIAIRAAGHNLTGWRSNRPVIRIAAKGRTP